MGSSNASLRPTPKSADTGAEPSALEDMADAFAYLDDLRESGLTNMYGAGQYLELFMGLDRRAARHVLGRWMETFGDGKSTPAERAAKALGREAASPAPGPSQATEAP